MRLPLLWSIALLLIAGEVAAHGGQYRSPVAYERLPVVQPPTNPAGPWTFLDRGAYAVVPSLRFEQELVELTRRVEPLLPDRPLRPDDVIALPELDLDALALGLMTDWARFEAAPEPGWICALSERLAAVQLLVGLDPFAEPALADQARALFAPALVHEHERCEGWSVAFHGLRRAFLLHALGYHAEADAVPVEARRGQLCHVRCAGRSVRARSRWRPFAAQRSALEHVRVHRAWKAEARGDVDEALRQRVALWQQQVAGALHGTDHVPARVHTGLLLLRTDREREGVALLQDVVDRMGSDPLAAIARGTLASLGVLRRDR